MCIRLLGFSLIIILIPIIVFLIILFFNSRNQVNKFIEESYNKQIYVADFFTKDLCVTNEEVEFKEFYRHDKFHGALLFDIKEQEIIYSEQANEKLFPASTTKIMTAYLALKYSDLSDIVTISKEAVDVPSDSSTAHLKVGDRLTMKDLLYALMLPSGNDSAVAIAEHISGSTEEFVALMNEEANKLGATNTHFVNPHGYQNKEHYTTAYDLYLIFNECIKNETFLKIVSSQSYTSYITEKSGATREAVWPQSNQFVSGLRDVPKGIDIIGGKTGNTFDAGSCIVLYAKDDNNTPYIAIMMGASSRRNLYDNMTFLWYAVAE